MAVLQDYTRLTYTADGVGAVYPATWRYLDADDVEVYLGPDLLTLVLQTRGTHYTITPETGTSGGIVTMLSVPAAGQLVQLRRRTPRRQPMVLVTNGPFQARAVEEAADRSILISQEIEAGELAAGELVHGNQGGGALHAAVVRGGAAGFMDGVVLDSILDVTEALATHKGAGGTTEHPAVTSLDAGFMTPALLAQLQALAALDPALTDVAQFFSTDGWTLTGTGAATIETDAAALGDGDGGVVLLATEALGTIVFERNGRAGRPTRNPRVRVRWRNVNHEHGPIAIGFRNNTYTQFANVYTSGATLVARIKNGATEALETIDFPITEWQEIDIRCTGGGTAWEFRVNGSLVATLDSVGALPVTSVPLSVYASVTRSAADNQSLYLDYAVTSWDA